MDRFISHHRTQAYRSASVKRLSRWMLRRFAFYMPPTVAHPVCYLARSVCPRTLEVQVLCPSTAWTAGATSPGTSSICLDDRAFAAALRRPCFSSPGTTSGCDASRSISSPSSRGRRYLRTHDSSVVTISKNVHRKGRGKEVRKGGRGWEGSVPLCEFLGEPGLAG